MSPPSTSEAPAVADHTRWFAEEVHAHDSQLKAYLRGSFPHVRDVDDVVQESYLRIWKARAAQPIRSARAFLFTVARSVALNILRKNSNAPFSPVGESATGQILDEGPDARANALAQERIDLLADALMTLPARCREITVLHKVHGLPQRTIAERLGISERTVESHVRIGVVRCLQFLQRRGFENLRDDD